MSSIARETRLDLIARDLAVSLTQPPDMDARALLLAIARIESSSGEQAIPRFEPAYSIGGYYFNRSPEVREEWARHGDWASCSYGPWQILYVTARELGFRGTPGGLQDWATCGEYAVRYLNRRAFGKGAKTVAEVGDAYNSGTHRDGFRPHQYIEKLEDAYRYFIGGTE